LNPADARALPVASDDAPVFAEPWQAQLFALTVALHEAGRFSWPDWTAAFSERLRGAAADGSDYFEHWLATLETLLVARGHAGGEELADLAAAWQRAARATPHGRPILLENDPEAGG
jgi:nitrile hydratase accessory protein